MKSRFLDAENFAEGNPDADPSQEIISRWVINLPDFERADDLWRRGGELYLDNMEQNGFFRVRKDIRPGDVILFCYASSRANHAALYTGDQTIIHHIPNQLSKREAYNPRWQHMTHSIWRYRHWQPSGFTGICNDLDAVLI